MKAARKLNLAAQNTVKQLLIYRMKRKAIYIFIE
jgi:hypothetical protein